MVPARSLQQPGLPADYYAPDYLIEVDQQALDSATKGDVIDLKVTLDKDSIGSFALTINNWDDKLLAFKYSDGNAFALGNRIHVKLGYAGKLVSVLRGIVTSLAPQFPESGPPTLSVGCQDSLVKLKGRKPAEGEQKKYVDMADWEIAQAVAQRNGLRFNGTQQGPQHELVMQKNQDDAQFLVERAKRIDYDCYIGVDPQSGQDQLNFIKPTGRDGRPVRVYTFEWGKSLMNFSPTLSLAHQVGKVTVRGWDPRNKEPIQYTATKDDLPELPGAGSGASGPGTAQEKMGDKQDVVVDRPVSSTEEARHLAISLLRERAQLFMTGSGQVIGLADLRPGDKVELKGLGKRFDGTYEVTKVVHSLGGSGFTTRFDVCHPYAGGAS
jgi:phage protein D